MRNTFAETFYQAAQRDSRLCLIVADISPAGAIDKFRTTYPDRLVNTGVAEQIMIGMCAEMVLRGLRPFAHTIATFALLRPYEMVRDDHCYQNLPVTVVGIGGGVTYSTLGGTHHAQEDVALACAIPNMNVIAPCDPAETRLATEWCMTQERGPVYFRLGKAGEPDLTKDAVDPWSFGRLRYLTRGRDVCILSYGPIVKLASDIAEWFRAQGRTVSLASVHTLKPLDIDGVRSALFGHDQVVVIEKLAPYGGLGPRVKAIAWEAKASCRLDSFASTMRFTTSTARTATCSRPTG